MRMYKHKYKQLYIHLRKFSFSFTKRFPGYDGVLNFEDELADYIRKELDLNYEHPHVINGEVDPSSMI